MALDEFGQIAKDKLSVNITEYNEIVRQIKALGGDLDEVVELVKADESDSKVVQANALITDLDRRLNEAVAALNAYAREIAESRVANVSGDVEKLNAGADALFKRIKSSTNYIVEMYGDDSLEGLPEVVGRKGRAKPTSGAGGGEKQSRIRGVDVTVDGKPAVQKDAKGVLRSNFSVAAKAAGVDTKVLQEAFWTAAGTRDSKAYPPRTEFDVNGHTVIVTRLTEDETPQDAADNVEESAA